MEKTNTKSLLKMICGAISFVFLVYSYFFIYSKIRLLSAETSAAKRSIIMLDEKRKEFELAKSNFERQSSNVTTLESVFFSENNFVDLLNTFEKLGRTAGVKFQAKDIKIPESGGGEARISFELLGNFESIAKFLVLLDNGRYSGMVNAFSLFKEDEDPKILTTKIDYLLFNYK